MTVHRLPAGVELISGLSELGAALGYQVRSEHGLGGEAVDVAWFATRDQQFPLFVFEVESRLTNSATGNPTKIFGRKNEDLEKPLFFFHIFLRGGHRSPKIGELRTLFGTHNYRVYRFDLNEGSDLLRDVFAQHARLSDRMDIIAVGRALSTPWWARQPAAIDAALATIAALDFEGRHGTLLPGYARLALTSDRYLLEFLSRLRAHVTKATGPVADYQTFLGHHWQEPIHLALLAAAYPAEAGTYLTKFCEWQEDASGMTAIGPHFGLSRDYDDFVLGQAPSFFGLLACLMREPQAQRYLYAQLRKIMDAVRPGTHVWTFMAVWLLILTGHSGCLDEEYEAIRSIVSNYGGLTDSALREPPAAIDPDDSSWMAEVGGTARRDVPTLSAFRGRRPSVQDSEAALRRGMRLAIRSLVEETVGLYWEGELLAALTSIALVSPHSPQYAST